LQSNFARQICAGARALGLEPYCFYFTARPMQLEGNLLLNHLMGAHLHFIPFGQGDEPTMTVEQALRLVRWVVRLTPACWGKRVYFMPVGGHTPLGCLGYVLEAMEIEAQLRERGVERATIVTASGTGGTLAGLLAGQHLLQSRHTVLGIDVGKLWRAFPASIAALASKTCALLGAPHTFRAADAPIIERTYVGRAYAQPRGRRTWRL
jgi:D-cysteine desulfhydrase